MEGLVNDLGGGLVVTEEDNDTSLPHPRFDQYKARTRRSDQEVRRWDRLKRQKEQRQRVTAANRALSSDDDDSTGSLVTSEATLKDVVSQAPSHAGDSGGGDRKEACMEVEDASAGSCGAAKRAREKRSSRDRYSHQLMLSEWLVELPDDFSEKWVMKICPVGRRCLVVAGRGTTSAYSRSGHKINTFQSLLPGGCRQSGRGKAGYTMFDCVYVESQGMYCVLDVLYWHGSSMQQLETDCRFFWVKSRIDESPELKSISKHNPYTFVDILPVACEPAALREALSRTPDLKVDGLLFYHREGEYEAGRTPLLCWLRPSMLAEIIGIATPEVFLVSCVADERCVPLAASKAAKEKSMDTE